MGGHGIIGWIIVGLIVGAIAKFIMPGRDPGGWIVTIVLGIAGSVLAGWGGSHLFGWYADGSAAGWIASIIGAIILLAIYRLVVSRSAIR